MLLKDELILRLYVEGATYLCMFKGGHSLSEDRKDMFFEVVGLHATAIILISLILCAKAESKRMYRAKFLQSCRTIPKVNRSSDLECEGHNIQD